MGDRGAHARVVRRIVEALALVALAANPGVRVAQAARPTVFAAPPSTATVADRAKARRAQQAGEAKLAKGDLEGALASFLIAATTVPSAAGFLQVARLHDKLGHVHDAVAAYEAYLELAPTKEVDEAKARIETLKATPGHVVLRGSPATARITIGEDLVFEGFPVEIDLPPGEHRVRIEADGYVAQEVIVDLSFAEASSPAVDLEPEHRSPLAVLDLGLPEPVPLPPELLPPAPEPPTLGGPSWARRHRTGLAIAGVSVAALGTGVAFGVEALRAQSDFASSGSKADADRGERSAFRADIAFGGAFLCGAAAAMLLLHEEEATRASVQFAPIVGAGAVGIGAGGRF